MVTKKFQEMAKRQKTEGFLESEAKKIEEFKKIAEEQKQLEREERKYKRMENLEKLSLDKKRRKDLTKYMKNINSYQGDEFDTAFYAFVNHPDFPVIYNQLGTIDSARDKWGFILRRAYEIGEETEVLIGFNFQNNDIQTKRKFENYGINLLCPYFRNTDREKHPKDDCVIDGEPFMTLCRGNYELCNIFKDRTEKAAIGQIKLPETKRQELKIKIPKLNIEPIDLKDLEDWWKKEGEYE